MKNLTKFWICTLAILGVVIILSSSCKKKDDNSNNPSVTTITDKDGNVYHTVTIGTQVWMIENLKTTKFNDGSSIPQVTVDTIWGKMTTPAFCWYDNTIGYKDTYGALYNWYAVQTGKLAPSGWHVPTQADWNTLAIYLGGAAMAGGKLKESGTSHWADPNTSATNESGFTAYAGGIRYTGNNYLDTRFTAMGQYGNWWSSTSTPFQTWFHYTTIDLSYDSQDMGIYTDEFKAVLGMSVRCIKD